MKPLTDNMRHALTVLAAYQYMGRSHSAARHRVEGNSYNALYRRDLFNKEDGQVVEQDALKPEAWAEVDMAEVMDFVRRDINKVTEQADHLQRKLASIQAKLRNTVEATVNSGWDVVEVEVQLTPLPGEDIRAKTFQMMVLSPTDDKSQAFHDRAVREAKDRSRGYYFEKRLDFDAPAEYVRVKARWTFGPVRREA